MDAYYTFGGRTRIELAWDGITDHHNHQIANVPVRSVRIALTRPFGHYHLKVARLLLRHERILAGLSPRHPTLVGVTPLVPRKQAEAGEHDSHPFQDTHLSRVVTVQTRYSTSIR